MTYDNWKTTDPRDAEVEDLKAAEERAEEEDYLAQRDEHDREIEATLGELPAPILDLDLLTKRAERSEKYRLALRDVYRYVDDLYQDSADTGELPPAIDIIDEVKRLISRVHT